MFFNHQKLRYNYKTMSDKLNEETPVIEQETKMANGIDSILRDATPEMMLRIRQAHEKSIQNYIANINILTDRLNNRKLELEELEKKIQNVKLEIYVEGLSLDTALKTYRQLFGEDYS